MARSKGRATSVWRRGDLLRAFYPNGDSALQNSTKPSPKTKVGRWTTISDEELLDANFLAKSPSSLEHLLTDFPDSTELPEVEFAYDTKFSSGEKIRCVHCKFNNHNKGFVLQFSNGDRVLVGRICGKKRYGADFEFVERSFNSAKERAAYLKRRRRTLDSAAEFVQELAEMCAMPHFAKYREVKTAFARSMAPLALRLAEVPPDGRLFLKTKVRDHAAEDRRYEAWEKRHNALTTFERAMMERDGSASPPKAHIYKDSEAPYCTVEGLDFFRSGESPDRRLMSLLQRVESSLGALAQPVGTTSDLRAFFKGMSGLLDQIEDEVKRVSALARALSPQNIEQIVTWAKQRVDKSYDFDGLVLSRIDQDGQTQIFRVPVRIGSPDLSFIDAFRSRVHGEE